MLVAAGRNAKLEPGLRCCPSDGHSLYANPRKLLRDGEKGSAHFAKGLDDTGHRSSAKRHVAGEESGKRVAGKKPRQQPSARACIAKVKHLVRFGEPADADALDVEGSVA